MVELSYKTKCKGIKTNFQSTLYHVTEYTACNDKINFILVFPEKIKQLQEKLNTPISFKYKNEAKEGKLFLTPYQFSPILEKAKNDIADKTANDITIAVRAELEVLKNGFVVTYENDEIEIIANCQEKELVEIASEYFQIYLHEILPSIVEGY